MSEYLLDFLFLLLLVFALVRECLVHELGVIFSSLPIRIFILSFFYFFDFARALLFDVLEYV